MDLQKIKYIADRYYINLDGFDLNNLNNFATDATFSMQQAIYIHEYYHYLTNITTFFGVRQFNCAFQDKVRLITILLKKAGLDAFPIGTNSRADCAYEIEYWKSVDDIMNLDDLDKDFYEKVMKSPNKRFTITNYTKKFIPVSAVKDGVLQKGAHSYYEIAIDGVPTANSFNLSDGMIDEFLNRSIDEYLFEHDMADNCDVLRSQDFYPYQVYDELIHYFGFDRVDTRLKIMLAYFALHSFNPVVCLIETLEAIKLYGFEIFANDPEAFLLNRLQGNELRCYAMILDNERIYVNECLSHGRKNLADTMTLIYQKQYDAYHLLGKDFFYFIRPFFIPNIDDLSGRQKFLKMFLDIRSQMAEPILVQGGKMIDADKDSFKNHLAFHIAAYEIFDSLYAYRIAQRLPKRKMRYKYPVESPDTDKLESLPDVLPLIETWHVALNDLSLYAVYLNEKKKL